VSQRVGETRPVRFCAGGLVLKDRLAAGLVQRIELQGDILIPG
jgi:hypothetical protein